MSEILQVALENSTAAVFTDPGGVFWPARVQAWIDTFQGEPWNATQTPPRISTLPSRAIAYIVYPNDDTLNNDQLTSLVTQWSTRTWAVKVVSVAPVSTIPDAASDQAALAASAPHPLAGLQDDVKKTLGVLALLALLGIGIVALKLLRESRAP